MDQVFDYIICGGGTSGCVIAARLAESLDKTVLLIEAGPHDAGLEETRMAGGWNSLLEGETDWKIATQKESGLNDRQVTLSKGKFLGGASGLNGTLCIRGSPKDFDNWGLKGWSGDEMFKYMAKAEAFHNKPWFEADLSQHGFSGPIHTEPRELAPISKLLMESFKSKGFPYDADMFTHGRNPFGYGHIVRTHWQGLRSTSTKFVSGAEKRKNLTIVTDTIVDKVVLEPHKDGHRAVAVETLDKTSKRVRYTARTEIIIAAGTYCTPAILQRSGVGSRQDLAKVGVPCLVNLVGVGKNLIDHPIVFIFYETDQKGLTTDHLIHRPNGHELAMKQWKEHKNGFFASSPFGIGAYARLDNRLKDVPKWKNAHREPGKDPMGLTREQPNLEFFTVECFGGLKRFSEFPENKSAFGIVAELFAPHSRGSVSITSLDPSEPPAVNHNYLADPLDTLVLAEACSYANEIVTSGAGTKNIVKGSWPPEASHHLYKSGAEWERYVRENATSGFHAAGTCKMGGPSDKFAVLDENLRVRGVSNLRVADCSIMPTLNGGHTQMPAYGIGEKAADIIIHDSRSYSSRL